MLSRLTRLGLIVLALGSATAARAQVTTPLSKAAQITQLGSCFPTQTTGAITPAITVTCLTSLVNSYQQYAAVNPQTGTSYTFQASDYGQLVTFNNSSSVAVTLPQAIGTFYPWNTYASNLGTGTVTITPGGGSTIGGASTLVLATGQTAWIVSDGTNYQVFTGNSLGSSWFSQGPQTPVAGTTARVDIQSQGVLTTALQWPTVLAGNNTGVKAYNTFNVSKEITSTSPFSSMGEAITGSDYCVMSYGNATGGVGGNPSQCVSRSSELMLNANQAAGDAMNAIISSPIAYSNLSFSGLEIDATITAGSTFTGASNGITILAGNNTYARAIGISSFTTAGSPNGYWTDGIDINYLASGGIGIAFSGNGSTTLSTKTGIDSGSTSNATFSDAFIHAQTNQEIAFGGALGSAVWTAYYDGSRMNFASPSTGTSQFAVSNSDTGASVQSEISLLTGTANSYANFLIADDTGSPVAYLNSGSAIGNLTAQFATYNFESQAGALWANLASGVLSLGNAGTLVGGLKFLNATSGYIELSATTGALGSAVLTLPDVTDTFAVLAASQTLTNKTLTLPVTTGYAIASLPATCTAGARAHVTNGPASAPTFGSTPSSTSTGVWPVMCVGNAWVYG